MLITMLAGNPVPPHHDYNDCELPGRWSSLLDISESVGSMHEPTKRPSSTSDISESVVETEDPLQIAVFGVFSILTAVKGVLFTGVLSSSSSPSVLVIVHSHFLFFSFLFRFLVAGVSNSLSAILLLISSNGPGVCPPSLVSSPVYAKVKSKVSCFSASAAEYGDSSDRRSICDLTYLFVVIVWVSGSLYPTFFPARFAIRTETRLGVAGVMVLRGGSGEFRSMLCKVRGCVYGAA